MKKKMLILMVFCVALFVTNANAANWDGGAGTDDWMTPANWEGDVLPTGANVWFDRALSIEPGSVNPLVHKALSLILSSGKTTRARQVLGDMIGYSGETLWVWLLILEIDRDFRTYLSTIDSMATAIEYSEDVVIQKDLAYARAYQFMGNDELCVRNAEKAMKVLNSELRLRADDARVHVALGHAYAFLGDRAAALEEGKRALDLAPVSWDALIGTGILRQYAELATMAGDEDEAIRALDMLRSAPGGGLRVSAPTLKAEPVWDPLRDNPGFKRLLEKE